MFAVRQVARVSRGPASKHVRCFATGIVAPGRLGNPQMTVGTDPRVDIRQKRALAEMQLDGANTASPVTARNTWEEKMEWCKAVHEGWTEIMKNEVVQELKNPNSVKTWEETITNAGGGEMKLYCSGPTTPGPHPIILEAHGSGLIFFSAGHPYCVRAREQLAEHGCIVVAPEYRKVVSHDKEGQFPAPLDDCLKTLDWVHENKERLGGSNIIAFGANGGANISQAMALQLNGEGNMHKLDGVFSTGPMLQGHSEFNPDFLNSIEECRNYLAHNANLDVCHDLYDGGNSDKPENAQNPLSRPYFATVEQMQGLCPHAFTLNECSQWKDEGIAVARKMKEAGVKTNARVIVGSVLAGQFIAGKYATEMWKYTARAVAGFAHHGVGHSDSSE